MVEIEKLVAKYLRTRGVDRVATNPGDAESPWVSVTLLDAPQTEGSSADRLVAHLLQLDCYAGSGGGQPEAVALAGSCREALVEIADHDHDLGTVTAGRINGMARIPDTGFEPARERVILTATVWAY